VITNLQYYRYKIELLFCIINDSTQNQTTNNQTTSESKTKMESIIQELNIRKDCIVSELSRGLYYSESQYKIINILQKYEIDVLTTLRNLIEIDKNVFFDKLMDRRMAYINRVRRQNQNNNNNGFIDLSRNQDDTENLACGITIMTYAIEKINTIIENKQHKINLELMNKHNNKIRIIFSIFVAIVLAIVSIVTRDKNSINKIASFM
jgi:hypothetical protein